MTSLALLYYYIQLSSATSAMNRVTAMFLPTNISCFKMMMTKSN